MAQPNKRKNFFQQLIDKYGEHCMEQANEREICKNVKGVFKDMAFGNIDLKKYGPYISHPKFIENAVAVIDEEYFKHYFHLTALKSLINTSGTNEFLNRLYGEDEIKCNLYGCIRAGLYNYKQTNDFMHIASIHGQICSYRDWRFNF